MLAEEARSDSSTTTSLPWWRGAAIYQIYELPASIQPKDVTIICGTAFLTCVLAGLFPAWKASRLQPVEALRYE